MSDAPNLIWPETMTPALAQVLGMPNFQCGPLAQCYRIAGHDIPKKSESEQAFILHRFARLAILYGDDWRRQAALELKGLKPAEDQP